MLLSREDILGLKDLQIEPIDLPEWGGSAYIRCMSGAEREQFEHVFAQQESTMIRATAAGLSLCDEKGQRLFTDKDFLLLATKNWKALDRIYTVARRLSVLTGDEMEALEKKEPRTPDEASGSSSLDRSEERRVGKEC